MVKSIRIEVYDVTVTTNMFRMTGLARQSFDVFNTAVKSTLFLYIGGYLLVAIEAQTLLSGFTEGFVALFTFCFIFGMGAHHLARHDQSFQTGGGYEYR